MSFNKRVEKFFVRDDGIKNIFAAIGMITATAFIYNSIGRSITGFLVMIILATLAVLYGWEKVVEPFTETLFGSKGEYTKITKRWSRKAMKKAANSFQSWVSIFLSTAYFMMTAKLLETISKMSIK